MIVLLLVVLAVVAVAAGLAVALAVSSKRTYERQNQIVPGQSSGAPASWAGAHTPEAKLHRRLGEVVASLRAGELPDDVRMLEARVAIEQQAVTADQYLIAVAALPAGEPRTAKLGQVAATVDRLAAATADLLAPAPGTGDGGLDLDRITAEIEAARARMTELAAAEPDLAGRPAPEAGSYTF